MASAERISFWDDEGGATVLEFTVGMMTFFVILFGIIEFSYIFYQWNAATKAVQFGARLAAVSNPVDSSLSTLTGLEGGALPGAAMPTFDRTCSGSTASCTGGTYNDANMRAIVYGRQSDGTANTQCGTVAVTNPLQNGMCNYFISIAPQNVVIRYQYTDLGYAGRPGGPVPTITVSVTGISYSFTFLNGLMGFSTATVPGLATTVTGEDLNAAGS